MSDKITIEDLEVNFHIGVPDEERSKAQKLLITIEMQLNLEPSALNDDLNKTIDYFEVSQAIKNLGENRSWSLIETLGNDICRFILNNFKPKSVRVAVKKFILKDTRWVSIEMTRNEN